ncbi:hypothetical protein BKA65DRAFT_21775 [Rhexocercosporidium sp. MPI-PUGE-AT-0058]|nr:hypothetical protein BKA65DRAFT_21775 [Rhexocercosporidium sp. MPI-PUGE-AT-0058]
MSTTTTDNPITLSLQQTLNDYELHLTGADNGTQSNVTAPNPRSNSEPTPQNPPSWTRNYHRVPNHRPLNRDLSFLDRPGGSSVGETIFITIMFTGVALNAGVAQLWGMTGGKVFKGVFSYAIGGEW